MYINIYRPGIKPNPLDGNYMTVTTDAVHRHWGNPKLDSVANGNQTKSLDSATRFRNTQIKIKGRTESSSHTTEERRLTLVIPQLYANYYVYGMEYLRVTF